MPNKKTIVFFNVTYTALRHQHSEILIRTKARYSMNPKKIALFFALSSFFSLIACTPEVPKSNELVTFSQTELSGIGQEDGVMRRDPSDVIKVGDSYYVWYSKGPIFPGYDATVWYATSTDGINWQEKEMAVDKGQQGTWEGASVFTPNILVAEGKYYLFYTGTSRSFYEKPFNPDSKIGVAVSDSPDGPWVKGDDNPVVTNSQNPDHFDSVAIADNPAGPYIKNLANPVIHGNHEVVVWPYGQGVAALIGTTGPDTITNSVMYAEDGVSFQKILETGKGAWAGGTYRPEAFTESGQGDHPTWGVEIGSMQGTRDLPYLGRFDIQWP